MITTKPEFKVFLQCLVLTIFPFTNVLAAADPQALVNKGNQAFRIGAFSQAASDWQAAVELFRKQSNTNAEILASVSLASAYQSLGELQLSTQILESALTNAQATGNALRIALVKSKLGVVLAMSQEPQRAESLLQEALLTAKAENDAALSASILNNLGNLFAQQHKSKEALQFYQDSVTLARQVSNTQVAAESLCNAAATAAEAAENERADELNAQALAEIEKLEAPHAKAFLLLNSGRTDAQIKNTNETVAHRLLLRAHDSFQRALDVAQQIADQPMQTYALGYMAQLYERDGQSDTALALTRRASFVAQQAQIPQALYRWEWQTGRLLKNQGQIQPAIAAYRRAVQTLQPIRNDVSAGPGNALVRQSFREAEGPLFYELADLLLMQAKSTAHAKEKQDLLVEARDVVESLKSVELQDYLCDECVDVQRDKTRGVEAVDKTSAVLYLIPLSNRIEVLVGLNSGLNEFTLEGNADNLTSLVREFRRNLETRTTYAYLEQAQKLYDWLFRPIRGLLETNGISTLVLVSDGALRTVPFAALHDGKHFLIQDFAIAVVPGLSLVEPKPLVREDAHLLLNGLSKGVQGFAPLDNVTNELHNIDQSYSSETLLNEHFTLAEVERKLRDEQFSIVHIASHGQFDRDVHKTFVLTYDRKLTLNDLEVLIRPSQYRGRPVELLVLSACQTASGDDRAALGLAGVAIKAGVRSALASLWFVNDQSTSALITEFYNQLRSSHDISKAQALRAAQLKLLADRRYRHPCYWSPYLLIGNWL
jgi:CHAT domain-containing protein